MIDIHHHCLPSVDDGPRELSEAVEMCAMAAAEGIEELVATPHVLRGRWKSSTPQELATRITELRERTNDTPRLHLGSEYFFSHDMVDVLRTGNAVVPLAGSRYVLVELASNSVPPMLERPFYGAQLEGWIPVLAHPERNVVLQEHPDLLAALVEPRASRVPSVLPPAAPRNAFCGGRSSISSPPMPTTRPSGRRASARLCRRWRRRLDRRWRAL
jgi:protein-tyrosine phosphatase